MGNPPRTRKRVRGIRRAPDGSAFENCNSCGVLVAIALADLHECKAGTKNNVKRFKGLNGKQNVVQQSFCEQPRSPFRLFMEDFTKTGKIWNVIDIDRKGFETWRNMSKEERQPYITGADEINSAHVKCLIKDIDHLSEEPNTSKSFMANRHRYGVSILLPSKTNSALNLDAVFLSHAKISCRCNFQEVDDEADSALVGKFDPFYEHSEYHDDNSESFHSFQYKDSQSFNTWEREMVRKWMAKSSH